jgi:hypothetical protein
VRLQWLTCTWHLTEREVKAHRTSGLRGR